MKKMSWLIHECKRTNVNICPLPKLLWHNTEIIYLSNYRKMHLILFSFFISYTEIQTVKMKIKALYLVYGTSPLWNLTIMEPHHYRQCVWRIHCSLQAGFFVRHSQVFLQLQVFWQLFFMIDNSIPQAQLMLMFYIMTGLLNLMCLFD